MKVYQAIGVYSELNLGGSTRPWVVWVKGEEEQPIAYVVKLFTTRQLEQQFAIAKEAFGIELASQFDLNAPEWGLVEMGEDFLSTLNEGQAAIVRNTAPGLKFGTKYEEGYVIFDEDHLKGSQLKDYDLGTLFAFDQLVWNLDRGGPRKKPNLLVRDEGFLLIDHEQIFPFANHEEEGFEEHLNRVISQTSSFQAGTHLLFPYLKKLKASKKAGIFDTFGELLSNLSLAQFKSTKRFLESHSIDVGNFRLIENYLGFFKQNPGRFLQIIREKIL